jgi:hypothetical protein
MAAFSETETVESLPLPIPRRAERVKATFSLSREVDVRITMHAMMAKVSRSELMEQLVDEHLREWVVTDATQS